MIHLTDNPYPAGTIIVAAGLQPRFYEFHLSLDSVGAPFGSKLVINRSCDIAQNFNNGIRSMVGEWAWFLGDDHSFSPTILMHLLSHKVDVVVPITPTKGAPWRPCILHGPEWREDLKVYEWSEVSGNGLMALPQWDFIGQAGMLVRKSVLDKIGYPWFKAGQLDKGRLQEDLTFCRELQTLGYTVWVDQDVIFDHHVPICVTARRHNGVWVPALKSTANNVVVLPMGESAVTELKSDYVGVSRVKWTRTEADTCVS